MTGSASTWRPLLKLDLGNIWNRLAGSPVDLRRVAHVVQTGTRRWVGDNSRFPPPATGDHQVPVVDPISALHNLVMVDQVLAIRETALLLALDLNTDPVAAANPALRDSIVTTDPRMSALVTPGLDSVISPRTVAYRSLIRQTRALGLRARLVRGWIKKGSATKAITDARGGKPGAKTDLHTFVLRDLVEDRLAALLAGGTDPSRDFLTRTEAGHDVNFCIGLTIAECALDPASSARELWRAVDSLERRARKSVKRDHAEEIAEATRDDKEKREEKRLRAVAQGAAARSAAQTRTRPEPAGPATAEARAAAGEAKAKARAACLAKAPANRSDDDVRTFGLCGKCREPGHLRGACTKDAVAFA